MAFEGAVITVAKGDNDVPIPFHLGSNYAAATLSNTTPVTLITGNPGYIVTALGFQSDANATIATNGMVSIIFSDSSFGGFSTFRIWVPATFTQPNTAVAIRQVNDGPYVWSNKVANSTCTVALDTTLVTGTIRAFVRFARTSTLG